MPIPNGTLVRVTEILPNSSHYHASYNLVGTIGYVVFHDHDGFVHLRGCQWPDDMDRSAATTARGRETTELMAYAKIEEVG